MKAYEKINEWARGEVGSPYAWGGTGQLCSPIYRKSLMVQYPSRAADMKRECQIHKTGSKVITCEGCKYKGKRLYDCAQFVNKALKMMGEKPPSGATSLWNKDALWTEKGPINENNYEAIKALPCVLFRRSADGKMAHVAINTGENEIVEAMSTGFGVVKGPFKGPPRFTHYAIPKVYAENGVVEGYKPGIVPLSYGARGMEVRSMQAQLVKLGFKLPKYGVDGKYGAETQQAVLLFRIAHKLGESLKADTETRELLNKLAEDA